METLIVQDLTFRYTQSSPIVLNGISFKVSGGEILAVTGLSGCGKSTLCQCLSGILPRGQDGIMSGEILVKGRSIREFQLANLAFEVGMVFQNPDIQLFSTTVEDELAFAPENMCLEPELIRERVDRTASELELTSLLADNPNRLSGGEKHLAALASVLTLDPAVLILDEVMSQLDRAGKERVTAALRKLRDRGKAVVMVEHELEGIAVSDRVIVLDKGKMIRIDSADAILSDRDFLLENRLLFDE